MGGAPVYVYRDGARLTPWMFWQIERLNADVKRIFGVEIRVTSGIRVPQEQIDIFLERYVTAANIRGRRVYDTRVWRGQRWYRISAAGTVAVPGTSNHEIQGTTAAVDIRDTGSDAGVTAKNSKRGRWIREYAREYDLVASGDGFAEGWHFDIRNIFATPPTPTPAAAPLTFTEEIDMLTIIWNGRHIFTVGQEFVKHETNIGQARTMGWLFNRNDRMARDSLFVGVDDSALNALQKTLALPWYAIDAVLNGRGFNIEGDRGNGTGETGRVWSRQLEISAKLDGLKFDTAGLAKSITELAASADRVAAAG